jgi:hypothetical protein
MQAFTQKECNLIPSIFFLQIHKKVDLCLNGYPPSRTVYSERETKKPDSSCIFTQDLQD